VESSAVLFALTGVVIFFLGLWVGFRRGRAGAQSQLDQALKNAGKKPVDPANEQIARLIPKRNIETWILCLNEKPVDEETDYKNTRDDWNELIPPAAETLFQWTSSKAEPPNHCVDSLRIGVRELNRLRF